MHRIVNIDMRIRSIALGMLLLFVCFTNAFAQTFNQDSISKRFSEYSEQNLQEKIYVHTDRELYMAGEILWFKLYNVNTASNTSINFSKLAYVEIIDKDLKPVLQAKIAIDKGSGSGSLYLPVSMYSGNYQLRAYTSWMKNFSPDFYFEKNIKLVNTLAKPEKQIAVNEEGKFDIQFFPEGGNMVESLPAKVAFRAIDYQGKGIDFRGSVVDENNNALLSFKPLKFGIGSFAFTPESGKTYRALIEIPGNKTIVKELPSAKSGYVLQLENSTSDRIKVKIHANEGSSSQQLILFVHTRQVKKLNERITLTGGKAEFFVEKNKLAEGISQFTLFNPSGKALAERLYFIRPGSQLDLNIKADKSAYSTRKKVSLELLSKDEKGIDSDLDASISVFASNGSASDEADIFNYLWLKSDLKGNVESPAYYLKNKDAVADEALDNLMLTHGWRRFIWQNVITNNPSFEFIPEIDGHIIHGRILDTRTLKPANNILAYLSIPGKKLHLYGARSNSSGLVSFHTRDIYGPSELVAQTDIQLDSTYKIELFSPFSTKFSATKQSELILNEDIRSLLFTQSMSSQVQNVYSSNKLRTFYPALIDSSAFYLKPDKTYLLDNFVRFTTMEEVLREYVAEVPVTRQKNDFSVWVTVRPHLINVPKSVKPLIILDGVPIFDSGNKIIKYDPKKVRSLDVLAQKYFLGPLNFEGILNFTTYKGNLPDFQLDSRATIMDYEGLQLKREFYSPAYENTEQASNRLPDFRNVLYWSPDIKINSSGKRTISFYTSDQENNYTIILQGLNASGKAGSASLNIQVKR